MSGRSSLEAVWVENHSFTVGQNSRSASKTRSNRRSISLTLLITLLLAIIISMGGWLWLWLLGGGILWLIYKLLYCDDWNVSSWQRRRRLSARRSNAATKHEKPGWKTGPGAEGKPRRAPPEAVIRTVQLLVSLRRREPGNEHAPGENHTKKPSNTKAWTSDEN